MCKTGFDPRTTRRRLYCSDACALRARWRSRRRAKRKRARDGKARGPETFATNDQYRRLLHGKCCRRCGTPYRKRRQQLDHRLPVAFVNAWNRILSMAGEEAIPFEVHGDDNFQPLCRRCHRVKTLHDNAMVRLLKKVCGL